jgi:endo-1,4-beta-xylanase
MMSGAAHHVLRTALVPVALLAAACAPGGVRTAPAPAGPSLKEAFRGSFLVGAAVNPDQFSGRDTTGVALIRAQFNTITPENALKWESVHPALDRYEFADADRYVEFGRANGMTVIGHTLVWHNQTPRSVFQDAAGKPVSRDTLLARMRDHIMTVVGRYRGRIHGWDVVNEALNEDGTLRHTPWLDIIGEDYLLKAYQWAHEADPGAQLYYNDYSLENAEKRAGAVALVSRLRDEGALVAGVGLQDHQKMDWPSPAQVDSTIAAFRAIGVRVNITELDVDVLPQASQYRGADPAAIAERRAALDPYRSGLPDSVATAQAQRYADLFAVYMKHRDGIDRVTFWGVGDGDSWLNGWPIRGRTNYPLLFDRQDRPKPALEAVLRAARQAIMMDEDEDPAR